MDAIDTATYTAVSEVTEGIMAHAVYRDGERWTVFTERAAADHFADHPARCEVCGHPMSTAKADGSPRYRTCYKHTGR